MRNKHTVVFGLSVGIGMAVVLLIVFFAGVRVGRRDGMFPFWGRRYPIEGGFVHGNFGHGVVGTIDSIGANTFIVKDRMGGLKTILVDEETKFRRDGLTIKFTDLEKDDKVIILGDPKPEEGAIVARVVRVLSKFDRK